MSTQTIDAAILDASATLGTHSVGQPTAPAGADVPAFRMERRDIDGTNTFQLPSAQPDEITWTLNQPTEFTFSFPKGSYADTDIPTLADATTPYEYLAYFDENLLAKGLMYQPSGSGDRGEVTCNCADKLWVINRRNIDAPRDNLVTNGSFESGFTDWTKVGSFTSSLDASRKALGTQAAKFEDINLNADDYYYQQFTPAPNGVGKLLTFSCRRFAQQVTGTSALGSRGLFAQITHAGVLKDYNYFPIDAADPWIGQWHEDVFTLWIPPNQTWTVELRVYAVCGTVSYDAVSCVAMDSVGSTTVTGSASAEADIARITAVLVEFIQDSGNGKSPLFVTRNCPNNGTKLFRQYQYVDHVSFASGTSEFTGRDDGFDISLEVTPTTSTFTTWTPKKGTDRHSDVILLYSPDVPGANVANYRFSRAGAAAITRETMMGQGSGPSRDEAEYADTSQLGGLVLQEARQAPPETVLDSLLPHARERVAKRRVAPLILELDVIPAAVPDAVPANGLDLIHTLKVGDLITVYVADGYFATNGTRRIMQMKLNCRNRVLTVFVNEEAV